MEELKSLVAALNNLEQSASFGQKYGPYFFAIALLVVTPFVCRAVFARSIANDADPDRRRLSYEDFRFYFRSTVMLGVFCVVAGVGWWLFENYRENERTLATVTDLKTKLEKIQNIQQRMQYTVAGIIAAGTKPRDEFHPTLVNGQMQVVFARMPQTQAWFFVVMSEKELPPAIEMHMTWTPHVDDSAATRPILSIPVKLNAPKRFGSYRFSFDNQVGVLQPIN
jgi:hypothetical protein